MTDVLTTAKEVLQANAPLMAYLTGGVYTWGDTKNEGINRDSTPAAYDTTTKLLKPCVVIRGRLTTPDGQLRDAAAKILSVQQILEFWFYEKADAGWVTVRLAAAAAFGLLDNENLIPGGRLIWVNRIEESVDELGGVNLLRDDYQRRGLFGG